MSAVQFQLFRVCEPWRRLDVWPFAVVYLVLHVIAWSAQLGTNTPASDHSTKLCLTALPVALLLHLVAFLSSQWSVRCECLLGLARVADVGVATHVLALPTSPSGTAGSPALVLIRRSPAVTWCRFQMKVFVWSDAESGFQSLDFPTGKPLDYYAQARGLSSASATAEAREKWGANEFDIPDPSFAELFHEHACAPFFVFQVLCVLLWSLDEQWYYSMFTLVMLVVFEGTVCKQRQNSLEFLRNMRRPPQPIYVFRAGAWELIMSSDLLPGDVCSLAQSPPTPALYKARGLRARVPAEGTERLVPCDMVVLRGSLVVNEAMLTGESVPQRKESLASVEDLRQTLQLGERDAQSLHRGHVVFGGTHVLLHDGAEAYNAGSDAMPRPPDHGCAAFVLRTGFETGQGQLMRTILFATERVTANSAETGCFIAILLVFAVVAAIYVLRAGLQDDSRNRYKLILHCIMIVTSVVPPELPMELSLAVTNSLTALMQLMVYCTEPFRIPFAGKVDVCCFDKTGTLTSDELVLRGIVAPASLVPGASPAAADDDAATEIVPASAVSADVLVALAGCHSLLPLDGKIVGDPLEKATLEGIEWWMPYAQDVVAPRHIAGGRNGANAAVERVRILHRHAFASSLRRMSSVVSVDFSAPHPKASRLRALVKGAPEALRELFIDRPEHYDTTFQHHMAQGHRVLALGFRELPANVDIGAVRKWDRAKVESDLNFAGFLVLNCPLKADTCHVIAELQQSSHRCVMITGDGPLTAAHVAREVCMISHPPSRTLVLIADEGALAWHPLSADIDLCTSSSAVGSAGRAFEDDPDAIARLGTEHALCLMGDSISTIVARSADAGRTLRNLSAHVAVFARVAPKQKELIVESLNSAGATTLMCGDGTNDVGALKQAHVGVSIINSPELERRLGGTDLGASQRHKTRPLGEGESHSMANARAELEEQELDPTLVQLGDASIASPFTSRRVSIDCVLSIVRQGRCTLVTTLQVFKILALNCLVTAYMLSSLYLHGVKQGDTQMTILGLVIAALFFCTSRAQPLDKLSQKRPPSRIFCPPLCATVMGQFAVHLACLYASLRMCEAHLRADDPSLAPDGAFQPNVINTAVFLLSGIVQVMTFFCNYCGHPFMQSLRDNKPLAYLLAGTYCTLMLAATELVPVVNRLLQLSPAPSPAFRWKLVGLLLFDAAGSAGINALVSLVLGHG